MTKQVVEDRGDDLDIAIMTQAELPPVADFMVSRDLFRASYWVNIGLTCVLIVSLLIGIIANYQIDNPFGNGVRAGITAIDNMGRVHEVNLHPQDPLYQSPKNK